MLRTGASRLALRPIAAAAARPATGIRATPPAAQWSTQFSSVASRRPRIPSIAQATLIQSAVLRRALSKDRKQAEDRYAHEEIKPTPETVSTTSTIHPIVGEVGQEEDPKKQTDVSSGMKHDLDTIRETFSMKAVPREAYYIGLAGVLPYLGTSLSTVLCAYELNHAVAGQGYLLSTQTASQLLHILEPLQIGYGAVIISFLGAIHWGLEFAGYGGYHGYRRYAMGVWTPAVAWPTVLMPVEYALISQFMAFTLLYYADTRAAYKGWTPPWYAIYRFVLTFIVGTSIVVSLIGRGEVADHQIHNIPGPVDRVKTLRDHPQDVLAKEEQAARARKEAEGGADGDDSEE